MKILFPLFASHASHVTDLTRSPDNSNEAKASQVIILKFPVMDQLKFLPRSSDRSRLWPSYVRRTCNYLCRSLHRIHCRLEANGDLTWMSLTCTGTKKSPETVRALESANEGLEPRSAVEKAMPIQAENCWWQACRQCVNSLRSAFEVTWRKRETSEWTFAASASESSADYSPPGR